MFILVYVLESVNFLWVNQLLLGHRAKGVGNTTPQECMGEQNHLLDNWDIKE